MHTHNTVNTPSRNAPCSCGSGKKYKRCCGAGKQKENPRIQATGGLQQVFSLYQQGNLPAAGSLAEQLLVTNPQDTALLEIAAAVALQTGKAEKAVTYFHNQLLLEPENALAHSNLCMALHLAGKDSEALESGKQAIHLDPDLPDAWNNLGNAYKKLNDLQNALKHYEKALDLQPNDPELQVNAGSVSQLLGDLETAELRYRTALKMDRRFVPARNNLGTVLLKMGRLEEAEAEFNTVIRNQPNNPDALINMSSLMLAHGDYKKAARYLEDATQFAPDHIGSWLTMGNLCERIGDYKSARNYWKRALKLEPENDLALCNIGYQLLELGEHQEARNYLLRAYNSNPNSAKSIAGLGKALLRHDSIDKATEFIEKALTLAPWDIHVRIARAHLYSKGSDEGKAVSAWQEIIAQSPDLPTGYFGLAEYYFDQNQYENAVAQYLAAETNSATSLHLYHLWSQMEEKMHHLDKAETLARKAVEYNPDYPGLSILQAKLARRRKEYPEALDLLQQIDKDSIPTKRMQASYLFELGLVLDKLARYREAFAAFRDANNAKNIHLGRTYNFDADKKQLERLKETFSQANWSRMRKCADTLLNPTPTPVFIVGFPRSGTSLLEQILGSHPAISQAGELKTVVDISEQHASHIIGSPLQYPMLLSDPAHPLDADKLEALSNIYMSAIRKLNISDAASQWVTDKMPHNALHLGLIRMMFPHAPIIHITRHPLNPCLSSYFSDFTSQHRYSSSLQATAQHYVNMMDLVAHYKSIGIDFLQIRYEDLVNNQESTVRKILEYLGAQWDDACMAHHESKRVVKTASYEQVTQKIYTSSLNRYQNYWDEVQDIIPILQPTIEHLGYTVEPPPV